MDSSLGATGDGRLSSCSAIWRSEGAALGAADLAANANWGKNVTPKRATTRTKTCLNMHLLSPDLFFFARFLNVCINPDMNQFILLVVLASAFALGQGCGSGTNDHSRQQELTDR